MGSLKPITFLIGIFHFIEEAVIGTFRLNEFLKLMKLKYPCLANHRKVLDHYTFNRQFEYESKIKDVSEPRRPHQKMNT